MTFRIAVIGAAASLAAGLSAGGALAQDGACDRDCLDGFLQQYLDAVVGHDPSAAPLSAGFRQTENSVAVPRGDGVWQDLEADPAFQRRLYDPSTGQAAMFGVWTHAGEPSVVSVRLAVSEGEILEAEWNIVHESDPGMSGQAGTTLYDAEYLAENPPPAFRSVPEAERLSRQALVGVTESYFDGIQHANHELIIAQPGCLRLENGLRVTGSELNPETQEGGHDGRVDCTTQAAYNIAFVAARRYPVVDVEQQAVFMMGVFLRDTGTPKRRNYFSELFWMDEGRISEVYSAMAYVEAGQPIPNWPPYTGNFLIPRETWDAR